jgi:outer membrane protein assembly factor BamB
MAPALADDSGTARAIGDTTIFATVPAPGHPFGVAVDRSRVYISTSAGDFFADPATGGHLNSDGERVFAYDHNGNLVTTTSIATMPNSNMGLFGLALDGNPTPDHQLYIADMNGRILRLSLDHDNAAPVCSPRLRWQAAGW